MAVRKLFVLFSAMMLLVTAVPAQTVMNDEAAPTVDRPTRGMTMDRVESTYGQPRTKYSAVGEPPITRWEYDRFVVYFEYQHVIHAVEKRNTT